MSAVVRATASLVMTVGIALTWMISVSAASWSETELRTAVDIEMMKGHLIAAGENYKMGEITRARAHASHPMQEHHGALPKHHPTLEKALRQNLTELYREVRPGGDVQAYAKKVQETFILLDQSVKALIPAEVLQNANFKIALLARLLEAVEGEYEEAVQEGKVVNLEEYQDAYGFLQRAKVLALDLLGRLKAEDRRWMGSLMTELEEAIPSITPPSPPVAPERVREKVSALEEILKRAAGK